MSDESNYECPHNPRCCPENNGPCWQQFKAGMAMMGGMMGMGMGMMANVSAGNEPIPGMMGGMNMSVSSSSSTSHNGVVTSSSSMSSTGPNVSVSFNAQPVVDMAAPAINAAASLLNAMTGAIPNVSVSFQAPAPPPPPTVQVLVNGYSMSPDNQFVMFDIEVRCQYNGSSIIAPTKRRFNSLFQMHENISQELGIPLPEFPPKQFGFHLIQPNKVERRMADLRTYFEAASRIPAFLGSSGFLPGLGLEAHPQLASVMTYFKSFVVPRQVAQPMTMNGGFGGKTGSCHDTRCKHFMSDVQLPHTHDISCGTPSCPNFMKHSCQQHSFTVIQTE